MKLLLKLFITVTLIAAGRLHASQAPHDRLIAALIQVESNGNDHAIGDRHKKEMAYGALQIRKPCVEDVNRRFGTKFTAKDMLGNRQLSVWVCQNYLKMYATPKLIGREPTIEDMARIWNGGPAGWKSNATVKYWSKVKKNL
jgi:hypothetical protein